MIILFIFFFNDYFNLLIFGVICYAPIVTRTTYIKEMKIPGLIIHSAQSLKYLLSGPLQRNFVNPGPRQKETTKPPPPPQPLLLRSVVE